MTVIFDVCVPFSVNNVFATASSKLTLSRLVGVAVSTKYVLLVMKFLLLSVSVLDLVTNVSVMSGNVITLLLV